MRSREEDSLQISSKKLQKESQRASLPESPKKDHINQGTCAQDDLINGDIDELLNEEERKKTPLRKQRQIIQLSSGTKKDIGKL